MCVCVCGWGGVVVVVGGILWISPPTQSPIPNLDWNVKSLRLRAGSEAAGRCARRGPLRFSRAQTHLLITFSCRLIQHLISCLSKHKRMSHLLSIYSGCMKTPIKNGLWTERVELYPVTVKWLNIANWCVMITLWEGATVDSLAHQRERERSFYSWQFAYAHSLPVYYI